jgi:hypothetical protein
MFIQRFVCCRILLALAAVTTLGAGCATKGRRVLLKEYGPSVPAMTEKSLAGTTIWLSGFSSAPDLVSLEPQTKPEEPTPFEYSHLTHEQDRAWETEMKALQKQTRDDDCKIIGNMRDKLGIARSHVYALNDPADWLTESLKFDLEAQGAKVVDVSQATNVDVTVSGRIQLCRTDMYFTVGASLVVDLDVITRQGTMRQRQIYTHGATAASLASEGEYFHALRDARQKFSILAVREISQALKPSP